MYEAFSYLCLRPQANNVCDLKLLVHAALRERARARERERERTWVIVIAGWQVRKLLTYILVASSLRPHALVHTSS